MYKNKNQHSLRHTPQLPVILNCNDQTNTDVHYLSRTHLSALFPARPRTRNPTTGNFLSGCGHVGRIEKHHVHSFIQAEGCTQIALDKVDGELIRLECACGGGDG